MTPEVAVLRCKFLTITRQLCLPLVPSSITRKDLEKFTQLYKDDPDFDKMLEMWQGEDDE